MDNKIERKDENHPGVSCRRSIGICVSEVEKEARWETI